MGYDSNFNLRIVGGNRRDRKAALADIEKKSGYTLESKTHQDADDGESYAGLYDAHWYDCDKDMLAVSKRHPDLTFEVSREGEDRDDNACARYRNGESEVVEMQYIWPPFKDILFPGEKTSATDNKETAAGETHEMKPFLLTCVNEEHEIIYATVHVSRGEAVEEMRRQYDHEIADPGSPGEDETESGLDGCSFDAEDGTAVIDINEDWGYWWAITEIRP